VAQLRGLLVALHIVAITLMALPAPGEGLDRQAWQDPTVRAEFAGWAARLNWLGIAVTQEEFEDRLWNVATGYMGARDRVLAPFSYYYSTFGTIQSWRMFAGPHRHPIRVEIEVYAGGTWQTVYRERDPEHAWLASVFDQYRFRPVFYRFGWYRYHGEDPDFREFVRWVGGQAEHDFPQASRVRVRLYQLQTPSPDEVRAGQPPEGKYVRDMPLDFRRKQP
jgi:hypothetical protein